MVSRSVRQFNPPSVPCPMRRNFSLSAGNTKFAPFSLSTVATDHFAIQERATGFGQYLDTPYTGVWDKRQKIHDILRDNQLAPSETLFIGDMQHDIETAKHGGIHSCAVLTGYNTRPNSAPPSPTIIDRTSGGTSRHSSAERFPVARTSKGFEASHPPVVTVRPYLQFGWQSLAGAHAQVVQSLGHSRRQSEIGRNFRGRTTPRTQEETNSGR